MFDKIIIIAKTSKELNQTIMNVTLRFPMPNKFNLHISCRAMVCLGDLAGLVAKCNTKNLYEPMRNTVIILLLLSLFSCDKEVYHNIPKNERPLLKDKDTVVFMDKKNNNLDSFSIYRTISYRVSDKRYYQEEIFLQYSGLFGSTTIEKLGFMHGASLIIFIGNNDFPTYGNANPKDVTVNGVDYKSIYVQHASYFPDSLPNTVYYSHQYGIIRYDYPDGRSYELINNIE